MGWASTSLPWVCAVLLALFSFKKLFSRLAYEYDLSLKGCQKPAWYPHTDPFLGWDLHRILAQSVTRGNSFAVRQALFHKCGKTYASNWLGQTNINTMDMQNIQTVLSSSSSSFIMSPLRNTIAEPLLGKGLLTRDGPAWQHSRGTVMPIFATAQIADLESLEVHFRKMLLLIPPERRTVDLMPLLKKLFVDKGTEFLFGQSINSLSPETAHPDVSTFLAVFDDAIRGMGARLRLGNLRWLRGRDLAWKKSCAEIYKVLGRFIDEAAARQKSSITNTKFDHVLLDRLLERTSDRQEICTQLINVFLAGRDQTGIAVSHVFFLLARHPRVWAKLRSQTRSKSHPISYESLKSFSYLQYVISESLRLLSPVGRSIRHCSRPCILPHGGGPDGTLPILVARGTQVEMDFSNMQQDPSIWGENSKEFAPERWEKLEKLEKPGWAFIPFLAGPRYCPARDLVRVQCAYVVVRMLQEFAELECMDSQGFVEDLRNVRQSRNGVIVRLTVDDG